MSQKSEEIIAKAKQFIFKNKVSNFSLNTFLDQIEISKGVFYHYFKSKDELIFQTLSSLSKSYRIKLEDKIYKTPCLHSKLMIIFDIYCFNQDRHFEICEFYADFFTYALNSQNQLFAQHIKEIQEDTQYLITQSLHTSNLDEKSLAIALDMSKFLSLGIDGFFICYGVLIDKNTPSKETWKLKSDEILKFIESICKLLNTKE